MSGGISLPLDVFSVIFRHMSVMDVFQKMRLDRSMFKHALLYLEDYVRDYFRSSCEDVDLLMDVLIEHDDCRFGYMYFFKACNAFYAGERVCMIRYLRAFNVVCVNASVDVAYYKKMVEGLEAMVECRFIDAVDCFFGAIDMKPKVFIGYMLAFSLLEESAEGCSKEPKLLFSKLSKALDMGLSNVSWIFIATLYINMVLIYQWVQIEDVIGYYDRILCMDEAYEFVSIFSMLYFASQENITNKVIEYIENRMTDPKKQPHLSCIYALYHRAKNLDKAIEYFEYALEEYPQPSWIFYFMGRTMEKENKEASVKYMLESFKVNPKNILPLEYLARADIAVKQDVDDMLDEYQYWCLGYRFKAIRLVKAGQDPMDVIEKSLTNCPTLSGLLCFIQLSQYVDVDLDVIKQGCCKVIKNYGHTKAMEILAYIYLVLDKDIEEAIRWMNRYLKHKFSTATLNNMIILYSFLGKKDVALELGKTYLESHKSTASPLISTTYELIRTASNTPNIDDIIWVPICNQLEVGKVKSILMNIRPNTVE